MPISLEFTDIFIAWDVSSKALRTCTGLLQHITIQIYQDDVQRVLEQANKNNG